MDSTKPIAFFIIFLIVFLVGIVVIENTAIYSEQIDQTTTDTTETILSNYATNVSLAEDQVTVFSAIRKNQSYLNFSGSDDNVSIAYNVDYRVNETQKLSVSVWVNIPESGLESTDRDIIYFRESGRWEINLDVSNQDYNFVWRDKDGTLRSANSANNYVNGTWQHFVFAGDFAYLNYSDYYINGTHDRNVNTSTGIESPEDFSEHTIGSTPGHSRPFNGSIDEIRIYNVVLNESQALALYNEGRSGHAEYDRLIENASFDGRFDTPVSSGFSGVDYVPAKVNRGYNFTSGTTDYINYTEASGQDFENVNFTVAFWIYPEPHDQDTYVLPRVFRKDAYFAVMFNQTNRYLQVAYEVKNLTTSDVLEFWSPATKNITLNAWNHVVFRFNNDSLNGTWFIDGEYLETIRLGDPTDLGFIPRVSDSPITIGNGGGAQNRAFNGTIDEVFLFTRYLSDAEAQALYLKGREDLVGYWRFNENTGVIAYDESDTSNQGNISATWEDDAIDVTLTADTDYNFHEVLGQFELLDEDIDRTGIETTYTYQYDTNTSSSTILHLIEIFIALGLIGILYLYIRKKVGGI